MDWETVLRELCCAAGVGGQNEAAQVAAGYLRDYCDEVTVDALGNVLGVRRCGPGTGSGDSAGSAYR